MRLKSVLFVGLIITAFGASACVTGGYQPMTPRSASGYSESQTGEASWRVEYVGETADSRETVERYMLRRAAELTVENGYDWFAPAQTDVSEQSEIVVEGAPPPQVSSAASVWRPRWRRRNMLGWSDWDPRGPTPSQHPREPEGQSRIVNRYAATADIVMGRGAAPANAFDARAVIARTQN